MHAYPRFALYHAPEDSEPLAALGAAWLGYDVESGSARPQPSIAAVPPSRLVEITAEPRRYGFHATLKPPFSLAPGFTEAGLIEDVRSFARSQRSVSIGQLKVSVIAGFIALIPAMPADGVLALAADCVRHFDRFRAPSTDADLARRRASGLTALQDKLLVRWGYPYVMEEFRFHMTLTGRLTAPERETLLPVLRDMFAAGTVTPATVRSLVVFKQSAPDAPFRALARAAFNNQVGGTGAFRPEPPC